jgi:3-hydroxyisobutyrate dehydrogenase-like beta-hydroxyacid dehydrogenase
MELKLVKNAMSYLTMCAVHESLLLGEELGFSSELVREVVVESHLVDHFFWFPQSRPSARPLDPATSPEAVVANRHYVVLAEKDLRAAAAAADAVGMDHPVIDLATELAPRYFLVPGD